MTKNLEKFLIWSSGRSRLAQNIIYGSNPITSYDCQLDEMALAIEILPRKELETDIEFRDRIIESLGLNE